MYLCLLLCSHAHAWTLICGATTSSQVVNAGPSVGSCRRQDHSPTKLTQTRWHEAASSFILTNNALSNLHSTASTNNYKGRNRFHQLDTNLYNQLSTILHKTDEFMTTITNLRTIGWSSLPQPLATSHPFPYFLLDAVGRDCSKSREHHLVSARIVQRMLLIR